MFTPDPNYKDTGPTPAPEQLSDEDAKFLRRLRLFCGVVVVLALAPALVESFTNGSL